MKTDLIPSVPLFRFPGRRGGYALLLLGLMLGGCANPPAWLASSGPNREKIETLPEDQKAQASENAKLADGTPAEPAEPVSAIDTGITVVEVTDQVTRKLMMSRAEASFTEVFGQVPSVSSPVQPGDVLEISIWEAPPALLFSSGLTTAAAASAGAHVTVLPAQMVNRDGVVMVPFAGEISTLSKQTSEIAREIEARLTGKANQPQVLVRLLNNNSSNVTVVGEVNTSTRMPLTPKGERLLDALAASGGLRQPVNKTTLQVSRDGKVAAMPLDHVIRDPQQNIPLLAGDVVTALFQPLSFTTLGATGKNDEIPFEAQGISLAQALSRAGGVLDNRADAKGIFLFRLEDPAAMLPTDTPRITTPEGKVPVVYQLDMKNPATFFVAQNFPIRDKDVIYVSNAPASELQKFLTMISSTVFPILGVVNAVGN